MKEQEKSSYLPFLAKITTIRSLDTPMGRGDVDSPIRQLVINGELWVIMTSFPYNYYFDTRRWKGPDIEHLEELPQGWSNSPDILPGGWKGSTFASSGMWYDDETGVIYSLVHTEYEHFTTSPGSSGWCRKKVRLATSKDLGLTWTFHGDVLTSCLPNSGDYARFSGPYFEMGPSDFDLYVDIIGGYFYVTSWNGFVCKKGLLDRTITYSEVARCAIKDKMAPGKWYKYCNGTWTEPGLNGKASRVNHDFMPIYGNTIYSTYLKRYIRVGNNAAVGDRSTIPAMNDGSVRITSCTDLAKQDWIAAATLYDEPGNRRFGYTVTDGNGVGGSVCGRSFRIYNYWQVRGTRVFDITLGKGEMRTKDCPKYQCYSYESHPEAGDPVESRRTRIVGSGSCEMKYSGTGWKTEYDEGYYKGEVQKCDKGGNSISFTFTGSDIYWRAVGGTDCGKAEVYIDDVFQKIADCYFWDDGVALKKQFAFIKTGLDPEISHTILIEVRGDKNPESSGSFIRHIGFEHAAESWWASAGYCGVQGKNNWYYLYWDGHSYKELPYDIRNDEWRQAGFMIGYDCQTAGEGLAPVRAWKAPHTGFIRIEGTIEIIGDRVVWDPVITYTGYAEVGRVPADTGTGHVATISRNSNVLMSINIGIKKGNAPHDFYTAVDGGDTIYFAIFADTGL